MGTTALLVIDMQNAYFNNSALERERENLIATCNELLAHAQKLNWPIYVIRTIHDRDKSTWTLNMLDDGSGYLFEDSSDSALVEGLLTERTVQMTKTRDSAFFDTDLLTHLHAHGVENVVICGVSTHSCVMLTAADAYAANLRVTLAQDAIYSHDPAYHDSTFTMLHQEYRQKILSNKDIIASS